MAILVSSSWCDAHRPYRRSGLAGSLHADVERDATAGISGIRAPPVSPLRARGRQSVLAEASDAHPTDVGETRPCDTRLIGPVVTVSTIGHSTRPIDEFIALLTAH